MEADADGREAPVVVVDARPISEGVWTPDGSMVVFTEETPGSRDIGMVRPGSQDPAEYIIATPGADFRPRVSRNGRWLAYTSDETGQAEIYVAAFPEGRPRWRISLDGGADPAWCPSGDELFYRNAAGELVEVSLDPDSTLQIRSRTPLFDASAHAFYDVFPACDRFLAVQRSPAPLQELVLALRWYDRSPVDHR
jgi:serine/threonine-protein kinase